MKEFLWGALAAVSVVSALFFLRFWRVARDRLFLAFAVAFVSLAAHWTWLALASAENETRHYAFVLRFLAFALIVAGIIGKNR